jgi:hypothetical protein
VTVARIAAQTWLRGLACCSNSCRSGVGALIGGCDLPDRSRSSSGHHAIVDVEYDTKALAPGLVGPLLEAEQHLAFHHQVGGFRQGQRHRQPRRRQLTPGPGDEPTALCHRPQHEHPGPVENRPEAGVAVNKSIR